MFLDISNSFYFVEGHALNDKERVAKVAVETLSKSFTRRREQQEHPSEEDIVRFLNGDEGRREIESAVRTLRHLGVDAIPKFIIEGARVVDGAAGPETFIRIFREIEKRGAVAGGPVFGDILGVSRETLLRGSHTRESFF